MRTIITPAVLAPAALAELKQWLGVSIAADDSALTALLRASLELCESFTGTMPLSQTCEELMPVTSGWQELTSRPVQSITQVQGVPAEGARFTLPVEAYAFDLTADGAGRVRIINQDAAGRIAVRFARIDALVHCAVEASQAAPPPSPQDGQTWLVAMDANGAWTGQSGKLAAWIGGAWSFLTPPPGMVVHDLARGAVRRFAGTWQAPPRPAVPSGGNTIDAEARATINAILGVLDSLGLIPAN